MNGIREKYLAYTEAKKANPSLSYWEFGGNPLPITNEGIKTANQEATVSPSVTIIPQGYDEGGTVSGFDTRKYLYDRLKDAGYSDMQSLAVIGNIGQESSFKHTAVNPKSGATGLAQWLGDRKVNLHKKYGKNPSIAQQVDYLIDEMGTNQFTSKWRKRFDDATNLNEATYAFTAGFERPGKHEYHTNKRIKYATDFASTYGIEQGTPYEATPYKVPVSYDVLMNNGGNNYEAYMEMNKPIVTPTLDSQSVNIPELSTATVEPITTSSDVGRSRLVNMFLDYWSNPDNNYKNGGTVFAKNSKLTK